MAKQPNIRFKGFTEEKSAMPVAKEMSILEMVSYYQ